jgi:cytochrome c biogenesis protein CcmG, thiol:disulfide interchange protein DsbE
MQENLYFSIPTPNPFDMKKLMVALCLLASTPLAAQDNKDGVHKLPATDIKTIDGKPFNTGTIGNNEKPIIISFWATWCKPCVTELAAIAENYQDWSRETGVKLIAISIDDSRSVAKVAPFVNGRNWEYEVYLDPNGDFKRAMNVNNVPHTFLLNGKGEIVWQNNSYSPGSEEKLYELVKKVTAGQPVTE